MNVKVPLLVDIPSFDRRGPTHEPQLVLGFAMLLAVALLAACGTRTGTLNKIQLHTPLQCPCPTIAPLAQYQVPSANSYFGDMATGSDGNLWFPEYDADKIARVTASGAITEFPVPTASAAPYDITSGSDGNLWFTEFNFNTIGRITTAGTVTEFPLPPPLAAAGPNLQGITTGPDGNLWFIHGGANVIGVMSTSGTLLATYQIPTPNPNNPGMGGEALFIVAGPDHNLWFDEDAGNKIGRITTSGVITEFPIPTANAGPRNLVVGPDGNIWFPELSTGQVARTTMSGVITEFLMTANPTVERLRRITITPDGSLWFAQAEVQPPWDSEIGKMNLSGAEEDLWAVGGEPRAIAVGPDGNPWFADEAQNLIVRL
jgi:streptogramin lyase